VTKKRLNTFIVSDATGATAESVLTSVLVQFRGAEFDIKRFPFTRTEQQILDIIEQIPEQKSIIVFTIVSPDLRELLITKAKTKNLMLVDVMGPLITTFSSILKHSPEMKPGVFRQQEEEMYRVTEAIHFTLLHDDGLGIESLNEADLIILGVSRTGKTPTSIYLSCKKLKVANIPVILDIPFPMEIAKLPVKKVGFRMDVDRLAKLRSDRVSRMSCAEVPGYSRKSHILEEQEYCEQIYRRIPALWTVEVTNRSIEETSEWITRNVM